MAFRRITGQYLVLLAAPVLKAFAELLKLDGT
jgi:hypothetical protein